MFSVFFVNVYSLFGFFLRVFCVCVHFVGVFLAVCFVGVFWYFFRDFVWCCFVTF